MHVLCVGRFDERMIYSEAIADMLRNRWLSLYREQDRIARGKRSAGSRSAAGLGVYSEPAVLENGELCTQNSQNPVLRVGDG